MGGRPRGGGAEILLSSCSRCFNVPQDDNFFVVISFCAGPCFHGTQDDNKILGGFQWGGQKFDCHHAALVSMCRRTTIIFFVSFYAGLCFHATQDDNKILGGVSGRGGAEGGGGSVWGGDQ